MSVKCAYAFDRPGIGKIAEKNIHRELYKSGKHHRGEWFDSDCIGHAKRLAEHFGGTRLEDIPDFSFHLPSHLKKIQLSE